MKTFRAVGTRGATVVVAAVVLWSWVAPGCSSMSTRRSDSVAAPSVATDGSVMLAAVPVEPRDVDERGYELGRRSTVEIGKPLIHRRLYAEEEVVARAQFQQSFMVQCGEQRSMFGKSEARECGDPPLSELYARQGQTWTVAGVRADLEPDARVYMVSKHVTGGTLYLLVDAAGNLVDGRNVAWLPIDAPGPTTKGLELKFVKLDRPLEVSGPLVHLQRRHRVTRGPSHLNFDLLYSGRGRSRSGGSIRLLYKEYSPYLGSRPLHSEEFTYDVNHGTITFKNYRIRVHGATDTKITYTVESDAADRKER